MNRKGKGKGKGKGKVKTKNASRVKKPPWLELPEGIWENILHRLGAEDILETAQKVCTTWRRICKHPSMWRVIDMDGRTWEPSDMPYDLEEMTRHAVDRSQGELVDINLQYFATDDLIIYIAARSRKLKRLRIAWCYDLCIGLEKAVQKLPLLEELSLTHTDINNEGIEALGRSCPRLKSFELNNSCYMGIFPKGSDDDSDEEEDTRDNTALTIAKNLPALHHLQLIGNSITNEGLQAILDGCPNLVSLDLRRCFNVSLNEVLSGRLSRQIKDMKYPNDSLAGFEFLFESRENPVDGVSSEYNMYDDYYFGF